MMQKLWQIKPKLTYSKDVIDIVQFGSSIQENEEPNDIDIAVIFLSIPIKEQLNQAQEIKKQLAKSTLLPIHIKPFDLHSFFDRGNFAREDTLFYGKSILTGENFSKLFGLYPRLQIYYELKELEKKDKVRFNYLLNGRKGEYGLLRKYHGRLIAPKLIEILPENEKVFVESINKITKNFILNKIFTT